MRQSADVRSRCHGDGWYRQRWHVQEGHGSQGIEVVYPSEERQKDVMSLIYEQIKRGEKGDRHQFMNVVHELRAQGCDAVILACTELSVLNVNYSLNPDFYIDAMNVVAKACIEKCGGVYCE